MSEAQRAAILVEIRTQRPTEVLAEDERGGTGAFWTVGVVQALVESRSGVVCRSVRSYHSLLEASGLSYQRPEGIYISRPNEATIAEFEADAEKK
jgi:transposase